MEASCAAVPPPPAQLHRTSGATQSFPGLMDLRGALSNKHEPFIGVAIQQPSLFHGP